MKTRNITKHEKKTNNQTNKQKTTTKNNNNNNNNKKNNNKKRKKKKKKKKKKRAASRHKGTLRPAKTRTIVLEQSEVKATEGFKSFLLVSKTFMLIKVKKVAFGNKEHAQSRKSETRFDWVFICSTVVCEAAYAP